MTTSCAGCASRCVVWPGIEFVLTGLIIRPRLLFDPNPRYPCLCLQIYDECRQHNVENFIFTTQKYYMVGRFINNYQKCQVSLPFKYSDPDLVAVMLLHILKAVEKVRGREVTRVGWKPEPEY